MAFKRRLPTSTFRSVRRRSNGKLFTRTQMKRRFSRFRSNRGKTAVISAQAGNSRSLAYRGRKFRPQHYRSLLFKDTLFKPHYRSVLNTGATITMPVGTGTAFVSDILPCLRFSGNNFWTTAGGAQPIDNGVAVPTFNDSSVILRGGRHSISFATTGTDAVKIRLFYVWIKANAEVANWNSLTTVPLMWDPSHFPDFNESFKLISTREFYLLGGSRPVDIVRNFTIKKIDYDEYVNNQGQVGYFFTASQATDADLVNQTVVFTQAYSLSFSGDLT